MSVQVVLGHSQQHHRLFDPHSPIGSFVALSRDEASNLIRELSNLKRRVA